MRRPKARLGTWEARAVVGLSFVLGAVIVVALVW